MPSLPRNGGVGGFEQRGMGFAATLAALADVQPLVGRIGFGVLGFNQDAVPSSGRVFVRQEQIGAGGELAAPRPASLVEVALQSDPFTSANGPDSLGRTT